MSEGSPKYQYLAIISGIFTILGFTNLVLYVHITKNTKHLSYIWIFLILTAQILLMIYGFLNESYGLYLPSLIMIIGILYIIYIKKNYEKNASVEDDLKFKNILE